MSSKVIRFTLFESNGFGHGGDRRTAQISELLDDAGISWERIPTGMDPPAFSFRYLRRLLRVILLYFRVIIIIRRWFNPVRLYKTILLTSQFNGVYEDRNREDWSILFWEMTKSEYSFVVPLFKEKGFRIVAMPHNLESLVPGQRSGISNKLSPGWFKEEIRLLRKCDHAFAISVEDTLLLKQFGIRAEFLPYFPSGKNLEALLEIRRRREKRGSDLNERKKILMLGSALNTPTRQGMEKIIDIFRDNEIDFCDLTVAGFGTERLDNLAHKWGTLKIMGELTLQQLSDVIVEADIALVHQPPTSGALTRIVEMLIAGVPVISNFEGARSYYNVEGVHVYMDNDQLIGLLKMNFPAPPVPQRPEKEILLFKDTVSGLMQK